MPASDARSAPTLKYFSYSDASTTTRTEGSWPSSSKAAASSAMRSSAIELLPLRCITTRAIAPSRLTSTSSPIGLGREERYAAGDLDHSAGDVARFFGAQEGDRVRDVLRLSESLEDGARLESFVHRVVGGCGLAGLGLDDPRRDCVGCDVVPAALERRRLGQADQPRLGRRVAGLAEATERSRHRRHADQPAPPVLDHVWPDLPGAVEGACQVHLHVAVPQLVGLVGDLSGVVERGGVVDEDVDLAELVSDLLEDVADLVAVGHIHLNGERLAAHLADLFRGRIGMHPTLGNGDLRQHAALGLRRLLEVRVILDEHVGDDDVSTEPGTRTG